MAVESEEAALIHRQFEQLLNGDAMVRFLTTKFKICAKKCIVCCVSFQDLLFTFIKVKIFAMSVSV